MSLPLFALILPTHLTAHLRYRLRSIQCIQDCVLDQRSPVSLLLSSQRAKSSLKQVSPFAILFAIHLGKAYNGRQCVVGKITLLIHLRVLHIEDGALAGSGPENKSDDGKVSREGHD
ncbi:hypothetical protein EDB89DRAFT_2014773 [Lactarius sanguifluus]|nr:hypothetical protein EDB89DRAFT_2014773 [Lactarius sanguifluus]